jgi:polo-like kinase 4
LFPFIQIVVYQPNLGKGVPIGDCPPRLPSEGTDSIYNFDNIPKKHWKKYSYASKFVDLVKSKTPKITFYSSAAKCFLMENYPNPDFEACFYEGYLLFIEN